MRILHLVSYPIFSGALPPTVGLALAQRQLGHEVYLAFDDVNRPRHPEYEEPAAPRLADLRLAPALPLHPSPKSSPRQLWRDRGALARLARAGVDLVHAHLSHDHVLALLARVRRHVPLVRTLHAPRALGPRFGQAWLNRRADGWITRCAEHAAHLALQTEAPIRVVAGGVDAERFAPATAEQRRAAREALGLPEAAKILTHVALIADRGQEELVGAAVRANSPDLHLLFVGRGEREKPVELLSEAVGLADKAHFTGYLGADELLRAYHAADAAFLAVAGNDASARAALEAMACGLPLIAPRDGALGELVDEAVGYPVESRAAASIAARLSDWLADGEAGARGAAARAKIVSERSYRQEAEQTLAFYDGLLRKRASR